MSTHPTACAPPLSAEPAHRSPLARWWPRLAHAGVLAVTSGLLITAMALTPNPTGVGTHKQLGLPLCGLLATTGLPCATCGMTTAFTLAVHGRLLSSLHTQPAGFMLALATASLWLMTVYAVTVGVSLGPVARLLWRPAVFWIFAGIVLASWGYKVWLVLGSV